MRVFVVGQAGARATPSSSPRRPWQAAAQGPGRPTVRYRRGRLEVRGLPAGAAVAELTIYRVQALDGATRRKRYRLKARVMRPGAPALSLRVRSHAPR